MEITKQRNDICCSILYFLFVSNLGHTIELLSEADDHQSGSGCLGLMFYNYPGMEHLKGEDPALLANFRLGRKGLPGKNTLSYLVHALIVAIRGFKTMPPGERLQLLRNCVILVQYIPVDIGLNVSLKLKSY